jgi:ribosomal protein S18 acetylase RimI-like enzyme
VASILPFRADAHLDAVTALFRAYAASLPVDLSYQRFDDELAQLPGKYAPPLGAILLAVGDGEEILGCVAIRPLDAVGSCEMKRLYIVPEARGLGLGDALVESAIREARRLGHREIRLDTLPIMARAIALYQRMGFERIEPYYQPTPPGTIFMALRW